MLRKWLRSKLYAWLKPESLWWNHRLPDAYEFKFGIDQKIIKDENYWKKITEILNNGPFLQEMAEIESRYRKTIDGLLMGGEKDWEQARALRLRLQGLKRCLIVLTDAHKVLLNERELDGSQD